MDAEFFFNRRISKGQKKPEMFGFVTFSEFKDIVFAWPFKSYNSDTETATSFDGRDVRIARAAARMFGQGDANAVGGCLLWEGDANEARRFFFDCERDSIEAEDALLKYEGAKNILTEFGIELPK